MLTQARFPGAQVVLGSQAQPRDLGEGKWGWREHELDKHSY